jgi:phosphotransferase system HPr (HPr) family protein
VAQASSEPVAGGASPAAAGDRAAVIVRLPADVDLHARPAADFVRTAMGFSASVQVAAGEREVDAKSLLSVLALGAKGGTELRLSAAGDDAAAALEALSARVTTLSD